MLENEINLIADKLGMTVSQVYQMNLYYQQFIVLQTECILITTILTFAIFMAIGYIKYKNSYKYNSIEWVLIFGLMGGFVAAIVMGFFVFTLFQMIILPSQYPEYTAMIQTINQIKGFL